MKKKKSPDENKTIIGLKFGIPLIVATFHDENKTIIGLKY